MKKYLFLISTISACLIGFIFYGKTHSFFAGASTSSTNTFAAAAVFPSPTVIITATPTMTLTPTSTPTPTVTPTPANIATHVVISEVQIAGSASATQDFIELYNPTSSTVSLSNYRLVKRNGSNPNDTSIISFTSTASISAHKYFLWASSDNSFAASVSANVSTGANISGNDSIALRNGALDTGTIIDAVAWNPAAKALVEGTEFGTIPTANQSLERKALSTSTQASMVAADSLKGNGFDTDNNATDFVLRTTSQPQNSSSPAETQ